MNLQLYVCIGLCMYVMPAQVRRIRIWWVEGRRYGMHLLVKVFNDVDNDD